MAEINEVCWVTLQQIGPLLPCLGVVELDVEAFCEEYGVSRSTLYQRLSSLHQAGAIHRLTVRGKMCVGRGVREVIVKRARQTKNNLVFHGDVYHHLGIDDERHNVAFLEMGPVYLPDGVQRCIKAMNRSDHLCLGQQDIRLGQYLLHVLSTRYEEVHWDIVAKLLQIDSIHHSLVRLANAGVIVAADDGSITGGITRVKLVDYSQMVGFVWVDLLTSE